MRSLQILIISLAIVLGSWAAMAPSAQQGNATDLPDLTGITASSPLSVSMGTAPSPTSP